MKKRKTYEISVIDKTYSKIISDETKFYTSDTALELAFELKETEYNFESAEIVLLNVDDRSLATRPVSKVNNNFVYEIDDDITTHYGDWRGQLMLVENGEVHVSSPIKFRIENDLYCNKPLEITEVVSWVSLKRYANGLIDELKQAVLGVEGIEDTFKANELERQTTFETNEIERDETFNTNETVRQTQELEREKAEATRQSVFVENEASRTETFNTNETTRQENEDARIEAEKQREGTVAQIENRQTFVENQFSVINQELTTKDIISAPEIIAARNGEANLKTRIDKDHQEVTAQLAQKADRDYVEATNKRVDNLLIESGDGNAEVADAHVSLPKNKTFATLNSRIEAIENDTNFYIDNEMKNGDFSDGFSNWTVGFANGGIIDGNYINIGDGTNNIPRVFQITDIPIENKKIYIKADIKPLNADCERLDIAIRARGNGHNSLLETFSVGNPVSGVNHQLSNVFDLTEGFEGATLQVEVRHVYSTPESASGKEAEIGNIVVIDLTQSFGEGNEPETSDVDAFLNKFNKRFFDGRVNYYDTLKLVNEIQEINEKVNKFGEPLPSSWDTAPLPSGLKSEYDYSKRMFIKRTNSISLDGTETWRDFYKTGTNITRAKVASYLDVINAKRPTSDFNVISNVPFKATTSISSSTPKDFYVSFHNSGDLYIGIPSDYLETNYTDNLKGITDFLKDNNVRITYGTVQTEELPLPLGLSTTAEEVVRISSELDNISVSMNERLSMLSYGNFGDAKYYNYEDLENRIKSYSEGYEVLGRDASDTYDIYGISVGNPNGKPILIHSGIHGNEWQGVSANLKFMELLASGALPDDNFLNDLLSNYYIYSIPCANPWGYSQTEVDNEWPNGLDSTIARRNANGKNCNRDWGLEPAEPEQEIIKSKFKELRPVGFLNIHLKPITLRPANEAEFAVGGTGKTTLNNNIVASFKKLTGLKVGTLSNGSDGGQGRWWGAQQALQDGHEVLAMITELNSEGYFSHSEQMGLGLMQIHMFLKYCINYIENNSQQSTF